MLRKYDLVFEIMTVSKKVNYLLQEYDLFIREYAKATPKWDELSVFECFLGKKLNKLFPRGGTLTNRFWGGGALWWGDFFKPLSNIISVGGSDDIVG